MFGIAQEWRLYRRTHALIVQGFPAYRRFLAGNLLLVFATAMTSAATPWLLGKSVDALARPNSPVLLIIIAFLGAELLRHIMQILANVIGIRYNTRTDTAMQTAFVRHIFSCEYRAQADTDLGTLLSEIQRSKISFSAINNILLLVILPIGIEIIAAFVIVAGMVSLPFAVCFAIALLALFALAYAISLCNKRLHENRYQAENRLQSFLTSRLSLRYESALTRARQDDIAALQTESRLHGAEIIRIGTRSMMLNLLMMLATWLLLAASIVYLVWVDNASAGVFVTVATYILRITSPFLSASQSLSHLGGQFVALARAMRYFDIPAARHTCHVLEATHGILYRIENYRTANGRPLNADIRANAITVIRGRSGIGKTTLLNALTALDRNYQGRITFCGVEMRDLGSDNVLAYVSAVSQHPALIPGTLRDNLLWGNVDKNIAESRIYSILAELQLEHLDRRGQLNNATLSGGEKQRIAIARAILKGQPVALLDEPTAALDTAGQQQVITALRRYFPTLIIITHNPALMALADHLIELSDST